MINSPLPIVSVVEYVERVEDNMGKALDDSAMILGPLQVVSPDDAFIQQSWEVSEGTGPVMLTMMDTSAKAADDGGGQPLP